MLEWSIGLTNMVSRASPSISDLSLEEMRAGARVLRRKLLRYAPRVVCFNGKRIYEVFAGHACDLGLQAERIGASQVYVMPSTSARAAAYQRADKLKFFVELRKLVRSHESSGGGIVSQTPAVQPALQPAQESEIPVFSPRLDELMAAMIKGTAPNVGRFCGYCYTPLGKKREECRHCGTSTSDYAPVEKLPMEFGALYRRMRKRESLIVNSFAFAGLGLGVRAVHGAGGRRGVPVRSVVVVAGVRDAGADGRRARVRGVARRLDRRQRRL